MAAKLRRFWLREDVVTTIQADATYICGFQLEGLLFRVHHWMFPDISARSCYPDDLEEKDHLDDIMMWSVIMQVRSSQLRPVKPGARCRHCSPPPFTKLEHMNRAWWETPHSPTDLGADVGSKTCCFWPGPLSNMEPYTIMRLTDSLYVISTWIKQ